MSAETRDAALTLGLVATFALLVTVHVVTLFGLLRKRELLRALGATLVPPLAPVWAFGRGMRARAALWVLSAALYAVALVLEWSATSPH
ncbi:MAG: hypothetical protein R3B70_42280 [Polyangiaceae bacterium]